MSQVFAVTRQCPDSLKDAILAGVARRLENESEIDRQAWQERVGRALRLDELALKKVTPMSTENLYEDLLIHTEYASIQFIVTTRSSENVPSPKAGALTQLLLRRTGLLHLVYEDRRDVLEDVLKGENKVTYIFNFPSVHHGQEWWRLLYGSVVGQAMDKRGTDFDGAVIHEALNALDNRKRIQVNALPPEMCTCPVVVFEPHMVSDSTGFVLFYHDGPEGKTTVSLGLMDREALGFWRKHVYLPLLEGSLKPTRVPYHHHSATEPEV